MSQAGRALDNTLSRVEIRVRGRVQGVGFRPMVWRHARDLGLRGVVLNDAGGVLIRTEGAPEDIGALIARMRRDPPLLASIESIDVGAYSADLPKTFEISQSARGRANTEVTPDAAMCADCADDVFNPFSRRYRYPFTTCTNCGPRLTVLERLPYDRSSTSMAAFDLCPQCASEYHDPTDRRFHAETTACHLCGPRARLIRFDGLAFSFEQSSMLDDADAAAGLIQKGEIVAIKGLGGYHLACDATKAGAVTRLRALKQRDTKPFALMARDLEVVRRFCHVSAEEAEILQSPAAPIVLLRTSGQEMVPDVIAPGLNRVGFMLPATPLHALLLRRMPRPMVMTSGNLSHRPPVIDDAEARRDLSQIATYALVHDRDIVNRVDDSVVHVAAGPVRVIRRARGYAPAAVRLPNGFATALDVLSVGGDLKSAFCLVKNGNAVLSQHLGDLDDADTLSEFERALSLYRDMLDAAPAVIAADMHPGYRSSAVAAKLASSLRVPICHVQHHHAHVASCLAENGRELDASPVLGIVLDGLGYGADGQIWGGEFLLADYAGFERLGSFKPVAMPGGDQAAREPWRNLYAHLMAEMGAANFNLNFADLDLHAKLAAKPLATIGAMLRNNLNAPLASSCGRLFDAAAAAMGLCFDAQGYEGEAALRLESIIDEDALKNEGAVLDYPFSIPKLKGSNLPYIEPLGVWNAILGDLVLKTPVGVMSARFHRGLARAVAAMAMKLSRRDSESGARFDTVALSGGCFNNRALLELVVRHLETNGFSVLTHARVPAGDGGLALGQAAIACCHVLNANKSLSSGGHQTCA